VSYLGIIAGLGNPGPRYERTRHNYGWIVLDELVKELKGSFSDSSDNSVSISKIDLEEKTIILVKPLTYMNLSGEPLVAIRDYYKIPNENVLVLHDEVDIPFGELRLKKGGGEAGHNGLKSISECFGSRDYQRLRLGIGKPLHPDYAVSDWVLGRFNEEEEKELKRLVPMAIQKAYGVVKNWGK